MSDAIIIGTGGHAISITEILLSLGYNIVGFIKRDDSLNVSCFGIETIGCDSDLPMIRQKIEFAFNGLGQIKDPNPRIRVYAELKALEFKCPRLISTSAYVSPLSYVGLATSVHAKSFVNAASKIEENCIINSGAIIEHGCEIGQNTHVSTGVVLNGDVKIGESCFIGSRSIVYQGVTIPSNTIIPAGSIIRG